MGGRRREMAVFKNLSLPTVCKTERREGNRHETTIRDTRKEKKKPKEEDEPGSKEEKKPAVCKQVNPTTFRRPPRQRLEERDRRFSSK